MSTESKARDRIELAKGSMLDGWGALFGVARRKHEADAELRVRTLEALSPNLIQGPPQEQEGDLLCPVLTEGNATGNYTRPCPDCIAEPGIYVGLDSRGPCPTCCPEPAEDDKPFDAAVKGRIDSVTVNGVEMPVTNGEVRAGEAISFHSTVLPDGTIGRRAVKRGPHAGREAIREIVRGVEGSAIRVQRPAPPKYEAEASQHDPRIVYVEELRTRTVFQFTKGMDTVLMWKSNENAAARTISVMDTPRDALRAARLVLDA